MKTQYIWVGEGSDVSATDFLEDIPKGIPIIIRDVVEGETQEEGVEGAEDLCVACDILDGPLNIL